MNLRDLLHGVTAEPLAAIPVSGLACHSKQVRPGDVFIAMEGAITDGHVFIHEAIARGAAAVVAQHLPVEEASSREASRPCPCVVVPDAREALAMMAARFYGHPSRKLRLVGVTGTNGKTTTTYLLKTILEAAGTHAGLLGTIAYQIGGRMVPSTNTTPGSLELQRYFAQMVAGGMPWCVMEVSSHALAQGRIAGLEFEAAIFTSLGSDHLDYHKTPEAYAAAKRRLFDYVRPEGYAIINTDDEFGRMLATTLPQHRVVTYGMEREANAFAKHVKCTWQGIELVLETPWGVVPITTSLLGRHNVWNIAAAATALLALGISSEAIRDGLMALHEVPGRLERIQNDTGPNILIDYAHTADALKLVLLSLREVTRGRLIVVFGCGGNRDQSKRPVMGKMASLLADHVVLTSDNPRSEDPLQIMRQIKAGIPGGGESVEMIADREQAIVSALSSARREDTVLIAGKGHEAYQVFDHISVPFSDREVVERWLSAHHSFAFSS